MKELMLYIHIPFCVKKCNYCDFLSFPLDSPGKSCESERNGYFSALLKEIESRSPKAGGYLVTSIFIGGGTPSLMPAEFLEELMSNLRSNYNLSGDCEITMEANPGTVSASYAEAMSRAGINRVSLGLQSAIEDELRALGRIHDFKAFEASVKYLTEAGIDNINVDLMCAIPGQNEESLALTVERVVNLSPRHISCYSLILEPGTPFFEEAESGRLMLPEEEEERRMVHLVKKLLSEKGYMQYEISNFAMKGYESRHNTGYWVRKSYLGFGLGAASFFEDRRFKNTENISEYILNPVEGRCFEEELDEKAAMEETLFLGLRMNRGVSAKNFREVFKKDLEEVYGTVIDKNLSDGLLEKSPDGDRIYLTERGRDLSNYVSAQFLFD